MLNRFSLYMTAAVVAGCEADRPVGKATSTTDTSVADPEPQVVTDGGETRTDDTSEDTEPAACPPHPWNDRTPLEPIETPVGAQVSDPASAAERASAFVERDHTAAAIWREADRYQVVTAAGQTSFRRARDADGNWVLTWSGDAPFNTDSMADNTFDSATSHGNPAGTDYPEHGYSEGDPRLSFPSAESGTYPDLMRRFSSLFDGEDAPDMALLLAPYANGGMGSHGDADVAQSRAPLVFRGPGIRPGRLDAAANHVDVAPTVAGLMGVSPVRGVDGNTGRWTENQMMRWQDGEVLTSILQESCAYGAASYGLVLLLDGLSHTELLDGISDGRYPNLARIVDDRAAIFDGGAIVGWPSFSLPGHVSLFTGVWQGHHGLISNSFLDRSTGEHAPGVGLREMLLNIENAHEVMRNYLSPDVETLFEAVGRSRTDPVLASINELTTRGATWTGALTPLPPPPSDTTVYSMADELGVGRATMLVEENGVPDLMALSLYLTDGAGQNEGPHGDLARAAIVETDERVGRVLDLYEDAGVLDQTIVVLTADHGMALMDSSRTASWSDVFVGMTVYGQMVYGL